jgi:peptidoglycan hydrolase-like protein with peptidoglycan-binding domain
VRKLAFLLLVLWTGCAVTESVSAAQKKSTRKASAPARKSVKAGSKKAAASKSRRRRSSRSVRRAAVQQRPTAERYREIQQALIDRKYLDPPATGEWESESVGALKRFQADQKLQPDGKLGALSLIALGLGPKRTEIAKTRPNKDENRSSEGNQGP